MLRLDRATYLSDISIRLDIATYLLDKAKLKIELEALGRILRLKWHFRNEENVFDLDQFKPKSTRSSGNKDAAIEVYMSGLKEKLMKTEIPKDKYNYLTIKERQALYDLKNDKNIVIKGADKGSAVVAWDLRIT